MSDERPAASVTTSVLLADDCEMIRHLAVAFLSRLGCDVTIARDGSEACRMAEVRSFDLILMDCEMPEMDGFEATRRIRTRERAAGSARAAIVALTGNDQAEARETCLAAGMDDVIRKPFRREHLGAALLRYVPRPSSQL